MRSAQDELKRPRGAGDGASARVTELLPRIIREIERASEGDVGTDPSTATNEN